MSSLYSYYTQVIFLSFIIINHLTEIYLNRRQLATYEKNALIPPGEFNSFLSPDDHQKAIRYSSAKIKVSQVHLIFDAAVLIYWFPMRGAEKLYQGLTLTGNHKEVTFILLFTLIQFALSLPWSVFSTFYLEEKFGFNKSTPKIFAFDRLKGLILGGLIGIPLLYAIFFLFQTLGHWWWLASFILMTLFQFFLLWIFPTVIAPLFNKFQPLEGEELKKGIETLVGRAGFNAKEVFIMDASKRSSHGNAYFTGLGKNKRVVFFDTLLKQLETSEILAILAHELGHMKLKHIPKSMVFSLIVSFASFWLMGILANEEWFYHGHFIRATTPGILILLFTQALPLYSFWSSPITSWISRRREFEADAYAAKETSSGDLIRGLLKLYQQNASPVVTDKIYSGFYHSHPPALERIKRLESFKGQSS
jgi:STE24 endopeptidase